MDLKKCPWYFIGIIILHLFLFSAFSLPLAYFPGEAQSRGISKSEIGYILAIYSIGGAFCSIVLGKKMAFWGRRLLLLINGLFVACGTIGFGLIYHLTKSVQFFIIALIIRFFIGLGVGGFTTITYGYVPMLYTETISTKMRVLEIVFGISAMAGTNVGHALYMAFGYEAPFYIIGSAFFVIFLPIIYLLPEKKQEELLENPEKIKIKNKSLHYHFFCRNPKFILTNLITGGFKLY